jgi:hypothetical protein
MSQDSDSVAPSDADAAGQMATLSSGTGIGNGVAHIHQSSTNFPHGFSFQVRINYLTNFQQSTNIHSVYMLPFVCPFCYGLYIAVFLAYSLSF